MSTHEKAIKLFKSHIVQIKRLDRPCPLQHAPQFKSHIVQIKPNYPGHLNEDEINLNPT